MPAPSSRELLWQLISERVEKDADKEAIDARIRELFEEEWAVVFTDLVGFSRRTEEFGILHFLSLIYEKGRLLRDVIGAGGGRILKEEADSWLLVFRSPVRAVETMIACQEACHRHNAGRPPEDRVELCLGIGYGKMLRIGDEDVWGKEVNVASRLGEDTAGSGDILVSESVRAAVADELSHVTWEQLDIERVAEPCWRLRYPTHPDAPSV